MKMVKFLRMTEKCQQCNAYFAVRKFGKAKKAMSLLLAALLCLVGMPFSDAMDTEAFARASARAAGRYLCRTCGQHFEEKCGISGRILYGKRFNAEAFTYGYACMDFDGEKRIYIVEPVYLHVNSDVMSEEESLERVEERLRKVEKLVANIAKKEETAVIPIFCVENMGGLKQLTSIAKKRIGTDMYQHALYTSENLISAFGGSLDNSFVSVQFSRAEKPENRKVRVNLAGNAWREFL